MIQGGALANYNGNGLEKFAFNLIVSKNYQHIEPKLFENLIVLKNYQHIDPKLFELSEQKVFSTQFNIGRTIYGTIRKCDFVIFNPSWKDKYYKGIKVIECKWQQATGSVDEKYPYLVLNIQYSGYGTVILLDGRGYKPGAENWLKQQIGGNLLGVYSMMEFQKEANNGFFD